MNQAINICITGLNNIGRGFWGYAAGIFIQASVLIALLLIIDFILRKRVRAVFRYCLWMLIFIKLVLPASFTLPTGIGYWLGDYFKSQFPVVTALPQIQETVPTNIEMHQGFIPLEPVTANEITAAGVELEPICWQGLVFGAWLVGILVLSALLIQRVCFVRGLIAQSKPAKGQLLDMLNECCRRIGVRRNIELRLSGDTLSPAVCGLFKPMILMPATLLEKLSREKLKAVLIHELAHIKRADIWVNLLQTMLQIVYFYNPLVWIANAMIRRVREQAVDEMVLVTLKPETTSYSNTLIDIAEMAFWKPNFSLRLIGVVETKRALQRRIKHMLNRPIPESSKLGVLNLLVIVILGCVLLPMAVAAAPEATRENPVGNWKSVDFVRKIKDFKPGKKSWRGDLYLKALSFYKNGKTSGPWTWRKGILRHPGDRTNAKYIIKEIDNSTYMFMEWMSGDVTIRGKKPMYYVLIKESDIKPTKLSPSANQNPIGSWQSVDFVQEIEYFVPGKKSWTGDLYLKSLTFFKGGRTSGPWTWRKGILWHPGDRTNAKYIIQEIDGSAYMFMEWMSGDVTIRGEKPRYYVLKKVSAGSVKNLPVVGEKAQIPATSTINKNGRIVDKIDYPFVNDPEVIGTWKSVDFVEKIKQFKVGQKQWKGGQLYLKELIILPKGRTFKPWWTWTKGLIFHSGDKTASKYTLKDMDGSTYMFFEWKSGDYTIRHRKPSYYVLNKVSSETGGLAEAWASQPGDAEFARQLSAKIEQLNIDTADLEQVKEIFGKPAQYIWGSETFTEDNLPRQYILVYPSRFHIYMCENEIVELRHGSGSKYVFRGKLRSGSTLDEVFEVIGPPEKTVVGEKNLFEDGVLYKDIDGRKGHCYYARSDQNVRLWFSDYKITAIYMTCSDYYAWAVPRKGFLGLKLDDNRWPLVDIVPGMPADKAGLQNGDKILKVNDKDISNTTTIRAALSVLHGDPGEKVKLTVQRGKVILTFDVERSKK